MLISDIWITVLEKTQYSILTLHVPRIYYQTCELPTSRLGQTKMNTCHKVCFVTYINHNCRFIFMRYYNMDSYFYNRVVCLVFPWLTVFKENDLKL